MNPAFLNLALSLGSMQITKRLPMDDPVFINYLRAAYVSAQLLVLGLYYYVTMVIRKKNDLTVVKYVSPASPLTPDAAPVLVTSTVRDYDLAETGKAMKGMFFGRAKSEGIAIMAGMHLFMKYSAPLFLQTIMAVKNALEHSEVQLHVFGKPAVDALARPFKAAPGLLDQFTGGGGAPQTDPASVKAAERAGGAKKSQ